MLVGRLCVWRVPLAALRRLGRGLFHLHVDVAGERGGIPRIQENPLVGRERIISTNQRLIRDVLLFLERQTLHPTFHRHVGKFGILEPLEKRLGVTVSVVSVLIRHGKMPTAFRAQLKAKVCILRRSTARFTPPDPWT
jgi:hypothetical protein